MFKFALSLAKPREPPSLDASGGFPCLLGTGGPCVMEGAHG